MGKIYCVMGKSSTGKDTVFKELVNREDLKLERIIPYTTRPIRQGETPGQDYHFVDEKKVEELDQANKIVELRAYDTVYGIWKYFTVDDENLQLDQKNYIYIVTLEGYAKIQAYFGENKVVPIYIEVEDGERLIRAISRERTQETPKYEEMCRRFIADSKDFSEEKIKECKIDKRFENLDLQETIDNIARFIKEDYES